MVLGLQIFFTLSRFGSEAFLGPAVALTIIRELGPVLSALMVTGRAGSALTAELGIMRITEQIDALTVMALSPMRYLVSPSLLAGIITFPLMTALFDVIGIFGGYLVGRRATTGRVLPHQRDRTARDHLVADHDDVGDVRQGPQDVLEEGHWAS